MSRSYSSVDVKQACDGADLAIVCLGTGGMHGNNNTEIIFIMCVDAGNILEHEDHDRSDLNLPGNQLQLLQDATNTATSECT